MTLGATAVDVTLFVCVTAPLSPGLKTRTSMLVFCGCSCEGVADADADGGAVAVEAGELVLGGYCGAGGWYCDDAGATGAPEHEDSQIQVHVHVEDVDWTGGAASLGT